MEKIKAVRSHFNINKAYKDFSKILEMSKFDLTVILVSYGIDMK